VSPQYNTSREDFAPLFGALELAPEQVHLVDAADESQDQAASRAGPGHVLVSQIGYSPDVAAAAAVYRRRADARLAPDGAALFYLKDARPPAELARWRNALWPWLHVGALVHVTAEGARLETLEGTRELGLSLPRRGVLLVARRRELVLSPAATAQKFDRNAGGWNAPPGSRGYAHFRWMRRFVARYARPALPPACILDFGCGAGWVGIEAALSTPGSRLRAFDPSAELVHAAAENARTAGIADFEARVGFGAEPPWPGPGEPAFDLVLCSGVVSFAPDRERLLAALARTVAPGGTLVIGDLDPDASGMRARRRSRPLLPARELNALSSASVRAALEAAGLRHLRGSGYQLTWPVPQLMHFSSTRLAGLLDLPLLFANRAAAALDRRLGGRLHGRFDSWVQACERPGA
jgi:SAM-dependent methyltransferase